MKAAQTGGHVWAERYDRDVSDLFAVQDEITENVVASIELRRNRKSSLTRAQKSGTKEVPHLAKCLHPRLSSLRHRRFR